MKLQASIIIVILIWEILFYDENHKNQSLISNLSYKEAENLLSSPAMEENHIMINESLASINESLKSLKKMSLNLSLIPTYINYTIPPFLNNANSSSLKIAKSDIELYNSKYLQLSFRANLITELVFKSIKKSSDIFNDLQIEMGKIQSQFEQVSKNLCLPLILNEQSNNYNSTNKKRRLSDLISDYKDQINDLGLLMNEGFGYCKWSFDNLMDKTTELCDYANSINTQVEESIKRNEEIINSINEINVHDKLVSCKKTITMVESKLEENQKELDKKFQTFENMFNNNAFNLEDFNNKYNEITENIKSTHEKIIEEISKKEEKEMFQIYKNDFFIPPIISNDIINKIDVLNRQLIESQKEIKKEMEEMKNITNVEIITSLDLLFIMDITGSMDFFLEEAKKNILNITNRIISECPGIDINLGFIGYRDIEEFSLGDYSNIDFTQNYSFVQKVIEDVWADGGGDDPEDIVGAFEMTLNKTWKSNARFAMLVADAPCHGNICHEDYYDDDYPNGIPGQRNITDIVEELAENKISLFCIRITQDTEKMFKMFENIYKKYENIEFNVSEIDDIEQNFVDLIVESASDVYIKQRHINDGHSNLVQIASYIINQLFGLTLDFSITYEEKFIVCLNPKVTVSLSLSCSMGLENDGYIQMQTGVSLTKNGIESSFDLVFKYLDDAFNVTGFKNRFINLTINGKTYFKFSENSLTIIFVLSDSMDYFSCQGTITITIEQNNINPVKEPSLDKEKAWYTIMPETFEEIFNDVVEKLKEPDPLVIIGTIAIVIIIAVLIEYFPLLIPFLPALA